MHFVPNICGITEYKSCYKTSFLQPFHMMAWSVPFTVLVAALLINTLSYCSAENVYCVAPTTTSCSSCPHNSANCSTLSEYAQEAETYFTSNTTMVFLPGDHTLDVNITVANVAGLTMWGEFSSDNRATIVRKGSVGFSFTYMVNFIIYSLAFTSYNRSWSYGSRPASSFAVLLRSASCAKLVNCSFHNNLGTALRVDTTNITLTKNNEFIHNQCGCELLSEKCKLGCGITALNSTLTFTGNTTFLENNASFRYSAGAIWASTSLLHLTGTNHFIRNSANNGGGAIYAVTNTSLSFTGTSDFSHNSAYSGGAIYTSHNTVLTFIGNNNFTNNSAYTEGGAIHSKFNTWIKFNGTTIFSHNSAIYQSGGAIYTERGVELTFIGTNNFFNNFLHNLPSMYSEGGAIYAKRNTSLSFIGNSTFIYNSARYGGAIYTYYHVLFTFTGNNNFINNSANTGGVIYARGDKYREPGTSNDVFTFNGANNFINNSANYVGGAIYAKTDALMKFTGTSNFCYNSAKFGGAIYSYERVAVTFNGTNNFFNNSAIKNGDGGGIFISESVISFNGTNNLNNNSANDNGGAIYAVFGWSMRFTGTSSFSNNSALQGGAIFAKYESKLIIDGNISFTSNGRSTGNSRGGALYLGISSTFSILSHTTVRWENNRANLGGAIYVFDVNPLVYCTQIVSHLQKENCFFQFPVGIGGVKVVFKNNSANTAGSVLYGGAIDNCKLTCKLEACNSGGVFDTLVQYEAESTTSSISSAPFHICPCKNNHPSCSNWNKLNDALSLSVYPGETFQVLVVSTGQRNGRVPSVVKSSVDTGRLLNSQYVQQTTKMCTTLNYTVFSLQNVTLELYAHGPCSTFGNTLTLQLNVNQTCPPGFNMSQEESSCVCDQVLQNYTNNCNITNGLGQITRESVDTFWVGYDGTLAVHPYCPFDYCANGRVVFPLNNTDIQCANNRSGILCGACKNEQCNDSLACNSTGYSLVLGSSHCKQCTNIYLLLLIPFAVMGVALVFLLLVCKLTVATGTLSGLVFYANIVGVNHNIFLPVKSTDAFSVFIAWLNLDFGIETCFYNRMDAYSKTWLQFVFPVYIWVLVGLMILVSHFSQRFASLLGSNPVSVLATLILLSYTKILRTLIMAVSFIDLQYQYNYNRRSWLHDPNVEYLVDKHIPLFLVAVVVFVFLFLPYTLLLLLGQWLQAISHLRLFSWVNRLKPFIDSYHAPYKPKHRYWPGLLLVLRFVLLLVFALNPQQDPSVNLITILVGTGFLQLWALASGGVYKNWYLDILEGSFVLNLIILVGNTYHVSHSEGNHLAVWYTSVSIALFTFIAILTYHIFQQVRHTKLWKKMPKLNLMFKKTNMKEAEENPINNLIKVADFNQLREPWLEDLLPPTHSVV